MKREISSKLYWIIPLIWCCWSHQVNGAAPNGVFSAYRWGTGDMAAAKLHIDLKAVPKQLQAGDTTIFCELCAPPDLQAAAYQLGVMIRAKQTGHPAATITVASSLRHARFTLDGIPMNPRQPTRVTPGPHRVTASTGQVTGTAQLNLFPGGTTVLSPADFSVKQMKPIIRTLGVIAIGVGVALMAPGVAFTALDGKCGTTKTTTSGGCAQFYQTKPGGISMISIGAALTLTGTGLLLWRRFKRPSWRQQLAGGSK